LKQTRHWATTLPEFAKKARFSPEVMTFGTESTFIAPVKYPALSQVTLAASHLAHPVSAQPCLLCSKIVKKAWDILPKETFAVIIAASLASDLSAAFLGKQHVYTAGEAIV